MNNLEVVQNENDIIEQIGDAVEKATKIAGILSLVASIDALAKDVAVVWTAKTPCPRTLRASIDAALILLSQKVPPVFQNGKSFLLPSTATKVEAQKMLFNAHMAAGAWLWHELRQAQS